MLIAPGLSGLAEGPLRAEGQAACLAAAFSYAIASVLTRRCPAVDAISLGAVTLSVGSIALIPVALAVEGLPQVTGSVPDAAILFLGLVPRALAVLIRVRVIRTAGSVFMTLVNYQLPVWSMVCGAAFLGERLSARFFLALALILGGLALSQWTSLRARPQSI